MPSYGDFDREKFYRNLKYLTKKHKMTLRELSEKAGLSEGYVAKIGNKNSRIMPGINMVLKLMDILNVTFEQLCYEELEGKSVISHERFDETDFLQKILLKTQNDEMDWERAKFDENTNCPSEELLDLVPWNDDAGVYTYKSLFLASKKEERQASLPFYIARIGNNKGVIIAGYSLYERMAVDFDGLTIHHVPETIDKFYELYIYTGNDMYPVAESNQKYESKEKIVLVNKIIKSVDEYVNQRKKRVVFKNFFDEEN